MMHESSVSFFWGKNGGGGIDIQINVCQSSEL
jgi:hypothetical protein